MVRITVLQLEQYLTEEMLNNQIKQLETHNTMNRIIVRGHGDHNNGTAEEKAMATNRFTYILQHLLTEHKDTTTTTTFPNIFDVYCQYNLIIDLQVAKLIHDFLQYHIIGKATKFHTLFFMHVSMTTEAIVYFHKLGQALHSKKQQQSSEISKRVNSSNNTEPWKIELLQCKWINPENNTNAQVILESKNSLHAACFEIRNCTQFDQTDAEKLLQDFRNLGIKTVLITFVKSVISIDCFNYLVSLEAEKNDNGNSDDSTDVTQFIEFKDCQFYQKVSNGEENKNDISKAMVGSFFFIDGGCQFSNFQNDKEEIKLSLHIVQKLIDIFDITNFNFYKSTISVNALKEFLTPILNLDHPIIKFRDCHFLSPNDDSLGAMVSEVEWHIHEEQINVIEDTLQEYRGVGTVMRLIAECEPFTTFVRRLTMSDNEVGDDIVEVVTPFLNNTKLQYLEMAGMELSDTGVDELASTLASNTTLLSLDVSNNNEIFGWGMTSFVDMLVEKNTTIQEIVMDSISDEDVMASLEYYLALNKIGRKHLLSSSFTTGLPGSLFPFIVAKAVALENLDDNGPSVIFWLLRRFPYLMTSQVGQKRKTTCS